MKLNRSVPLWEPVIIPLVGRDPLERPAPGKPGPVPGLYHAAPDAAALLIYIPGGVSGALMSGRHDYNALAAALSEIGYSLLVVQVVTAQRPAFLGFSTFHDDIDAAVAWARGKAYAKLALAGNGLGATRAAAWINATPDKGIPLLLVSAFESPHRAGLRSGTSAELESRRRLLSDCREYHSTGRGQEVVVVTLPSGRRTMAAATVLDYFGEPNEASTTFSRYAGGVRGPVALIHGENDPYVSRGCVDDLASSLAHAASLTRFSVTGSGHELLAERAAIAPTVRWMAQWLLDT